MKTILITGATSGIGKSAAYILAQHGYRLILCGRRKEVLEKIAADLSKTSEVYTLRFDVSKRGDVEKNLLSLPPVWKDIDILINNAGNAHGLASVHEGNVDDWDAMIDGNLKGLLYVTRMITPGMVKRNSGHIINIGSIAGREAYPGGNVYCASKSAVDMLTKAMRIDLNEYQIRVTCIDPGMVDTEFSTVRFKGDKQKADSVYKGFKPLAPEDIAEIILFIVNRPAHVNIADIMVLPAAQANATKVHRT